MQPRNLKNSPQVIQLQTKTNDFHFEVYAARIPSLSEIKCDPSLLLQTHYLQSQQMKYSLKIQHNELSKLQARNYVAGANFKLRM